MPTTQTVAIGPPKATDDELMFFIECPQCNTRRGFVCSETWKGLQEKELNALAWEASCDVCSRVTRIVLLWGKRTPGWTVRPPIVNGTEFMDSMGMRKAE